MIAAVIAVDFRCATKFCHHDHQSALQHSLLVQVIEQGGERSVKFPQLFQMEVEVLGVRVIPVMGDLDARRPLFQQVAGEDAVAGKEVLAVPFQVAGLCLTVK